MVLIKNENYILDIESSLFLELDIRTTSKFCTIKIVVLFIYNYLTLIILQLIKI